MNAGSAGDLRAALVDCLDPLGLALSVDQIDTLIAYLDLLQRWNSVYNLTAVRDPAAMLVQHLADCLAIVDPLRREIGDAPATLLDVGSGGGLPGLVIATVLPELRVTSVDAVGKKVAFIRQAAGELKLKNMSAEHARVESLGPSSFDVVASRAFATLETFVTLTARHLKPQGRWLAMKGKTPIEEMASVRPHADVFHVEPLQVPGLAGERCIVWMRHKRLPPPSL